MHPFFLCKTFCNFNIFSRFVIAYGHNVDAERGSFLYNSLRGHGKFGTGRKTCMYMKVGYKFYWHLKPRLYSLPTTSKAGSWLVITATCSSEAFLRVSSSGVLLLTSMIP